MSMAAHLASLGTDNQVVVSDRVMDQFQSANKIRAAVHSLDMRVHR